MPETDIFLVVNLALDKDNGKNWRVIDLGLKKSLILRDFKVLFNNSLKLYCFTGHCILVFKD